MLTNETATPNTSTDSEWEKILFAALLGSIKITEEANIRSTSWYELHDIEGGYVSIEEG
jgi:hypothetical protein